MLIFDSGVGGLSVLDAIVAADMALELDFLADAAWLPYGLKPDAEVAARVPRLLAAAAAAWRPDLVVIACNTASTITLAPTRAALDVPVVGVVPPIKPAAAATRSGVFGVLATPATIQRPYTHDLIAEFAADKTVIKVGSSELVVAAEQKLRGHAPDAAAISAAVDAMFLAQGGDLIDVVALSCTHFPLLREELVRAAPRPCLWLDSGDAIARRVKALLNPPPGHAAAKRVGFTDLGAAHALRGAFSGRGFTEFVGFAAEPPFGPIPTM